MKRRIVFGLALLLVIASSAFSQTRDVAENGDPNQPVAAIGPGRSLPDKPTPRTPDTAYLGELIAPGEAEPAIWPDDLVIADIKDDGRLMWEVKRVGSCWFCAKPESFKAAAFDKRTFPMWLGAVGLAVADIEVTVRSACFHDKTCREGNPLLGGGGRPAQYGIRMPILAAAWLGTAYLRKGDRRNHVGGSRHTWLLPFMYEAASASGVIVNLARPAERNR